MTTGTRTSREDPLGEIQTKALEKILETTIRIARSARLHHGEGEGIMARVDRNYIIEALNVATAQAHQLGVKDAIEAQAVPPKRHRWSKETITDQIDDLRRRADNGEIGPYDDLQFLAGYVDETAKQLARRGERYYEKNPVS